RSAPLLGFGRFQPDMDVLLLREGEHLLETLFAPKSRLLETAKGRAKKVFADLVDPHVTRLHSERGAVRGIQIIGPDRSREPIFNRIHGCEHLRFVAPFEYAENRPEDLLARYSVLFGDGEDRRLNEESVLEGRIGGRSTAGYQLGAFFFGRLDESHHPVELSLGHDRAHGRRRVGGDAGLILSDLLFHLRDDRVVDTLVDERSAGRAAGLPAP